MESRVNIRLDRSTSQGEQKATPATRPVVVIRPTLSSAGSGVMNMMSRSAASASLRTNRKMQLMKQQVEDEKTSQSHRVTELLGQVGGQLDRVGGQLVRTSIGMLPSSTVATSTTDRFIPTGSLQCGTSGSLQPGGSDAVLGHTVPAVRYIVVSADRQNAACSAPSVAMNGRYSVTSPVTDLGSTATSFSDADEMLYDEQLSLEPIDPLTEKDLGIDFLTELLPDTMLTAGSYAESSELSTDVRMKSSASCPAMSIRLPTNSLPGYRGGRVKEPPPPLMTEEERQQWERDRVKKDNHNIIEKRRRYKINDCITELATLLPQSYDLDLQNKKGVILQASVDYIKRLQKDQQELSDVITHQMDLEHSNRQLMLDIEKLRAMLQSQQTAAAAAAAAAAPQLQVEPAINATVIMDQQQLLIHDDLQTLGSHLDDVLGINSQHSMLDAIDLSNAQLGDMDINDFPFFDFANVPDVQMSDADFLQNVTTTLPSDYPLHPF